MQEKDVNGIHIKLTYRPTEMLVYQELNGRDSVSKQDIKEARERYGKQHYFVLSISQGGKEILSNAADRQRFSMLVNQFAFGMGQCVTLTTAERDTLPLLDFNYPRYFGMAPSTDILFAFEKEKKGTEYLDFSLNEFGLKTGNTRFRILIKKIKNIHDEKICTPDFDNKH